MANNGRIRVPPELVTTSYLSGGLAIVLSVTSLLLSVLAIVYRQSCSVIGTYTGGSQYFLITVVKTYILRNDCPHSLEIENLTKAESVFTLAIILLAFAFINFITAVSMISGSSLALLVVDLTLSVHFGMDHEFLKKQLNLKSAGFVLNYETDMIRLGALLLMSVALKGYIGHAINIVLLSLLAFYVVQYRRTLYERDWNLYTDVWERGPIIISQNKIKERSVGKVETMHSIHKLSVIRAFEPSKRLAEQWSPIMSYSRGTSMNGFNNEDELRQRPMRETPLTVIPSFSSQKRFEDPWVHQPHRNETFMGYPRSGQSNPAFNGDASNQAPPPGKESSIPDRPLNRSHSWLHNSGAEMAARPFSYLEDRQRPPAKSSTTSVMPVNEPQWRRDAWVTAAPPVPEPDYSPPPRKLKSALKSNYV